MLLKLRHILYLQTMVHLHGDVRCLYRTHLTSLNQCANSVIHRDWRNIKNVLSSCKKYISNSRRQHHCLITQVLGDSYVRTRKLPFKLRLAGSRRDHNYLT
jgi:hypothetical protein